MYQINAIVKKNLIFITPSFNSGLDIDSIFNKIAFVMKTILVVEDTKAVREEICDILRIEEYEVIEAVDGLKGLKAVNNKLPDLIITDILMPRLDGYKFIEELKSQDKTKNIPVIFLTAKAGKADKKQGMKLGVNDYLIKPLSPNDLLEAVSNKLNL